MELINGKFYRGDKIIPLEHGNLEQIKLLEGQRKSDIERYISAYGMTSFRHLIIMQDGDLFLTDYFSMENFIDGMRVISTQNCTYSIDGRTWHKLKIDHL